MTSDAAVLTVEVKPHPFAAVFHYPLTQPAIDVDGQEYLGKWGHVEATVTPGRTHQVSVYFRYRGQRRGRLGMATTEVTVPDAVRHVVLRAQLGPLNGDSFRIDAPAFG